VKGESATRIIAIGLAGLLITTLLGGPAATYYVCGNTWFQPSYGANGVSYRVIPTPQRTMDGAVSLRHRVRDELFPHTRVGRSGPRDPGQVREDHGLLAPANYS
jgi:hypothetical protein